MKFVHCSVKVISRSSGRSSVAAAAYRSGDRLTNERDGRSHDYSRRTGVVHEEVMLPDGAPEAYADRSTLWNAVEAIEKQRNSRLAREVVIALPNELGNEEKIAFVQNYVRENFVKRGMCADIAVHSGHNTEKSSQSNPHAHIMLTMRPVSREGFGPKAKKVYILDKDGNRIKTARGSWKSYKENSVDWDKKENVFAWRADLANRINAEMQRLGLDDRVDPRSYKDQGIDREPGVHMGAAATAMERRGIKTDLGERNREIMERNRETERLAYEQQQLLLDHSAEGLAIRMIEAREQYIKSDSEYSQARSMQAADRDRIEKAKDDIKELSLQVFAVESYEAKKDMLDAQKSRLGFFRLWAKRDITRQIKEVDARLYQAKDRLGISIQEAEERAKELHQHGVLTAASIKELDSKIHEAAQSRDAAERSYISIEQEIRAHPNEKEIRAILKSDRSYSFSKGKEKLSDLLAKISADQRLEKSADKELGKNERDLERAARGRDRDDGLER
ncbi:MAG: MobA/MobL family protein [Eubacteriaceae bacterium]|nr:MobA/MobL family protein [Eubacteriaceae bacterium]